MCFEFVLMCDNISKFFIKFCIWWVCDVIFFIVFCMNGLEFLLIGRILRYLLMIVSGVCNLWDIFVIKFLCIFLSWDICVMLWVISNKCLLL